MYEYAVKKKREQGIVDITSLIKIGIIKNQVSKIEVFKIESY